MDSVQISPVVQAVRTAMEIEIGRLEDPFGNQMGTTLWFAQMVKIVERLLAAHASLVTVAIMALGLDHLTVVERAVLKVVACGSISCLTVGGLLLSLHQAKLAVVNWRVAIVHAQVCLLLLPVALPSLPSSSLQLRLFLGAPGNGRP